MPLIPKWTKEIKLTQRALDPLGLSRLSEHIVDKLLPGITSLTNRTRNYSFYTWAIKVINSSNLTSRIEFNEKIAKLEATYVVGGLLDAFDNFPDSKGPIGKVKATNRIKNTEGDFLDLNFSILNHPGGGYGQYFRTAMHQLALTIPSQKTDFLTDKGNEIANIFEQNVRDTTYVDEYLLEENVEKKVLKEFGKKCSYLRLCDFLDERMGLIDVFFNKNQNISVFQESRKKTFLFILDLFNLFTELNINLDENTFREIIYHSSYKYRNEIKGTIKFSRDLANS